MQPQKPLTSSQKMKQYRARMREAGLRPVQLWIPDLRSPRMESEFRRQCLLASQGPDEESVMAFLDAVSAWDDQA